MLTLALDSACYVAYDLTRCTLYKAWKGGISVEGAAFTEKKNVQPTSWGATYVSDSSQHYQWIVEADGKKELANAVHQGYVLQENQIHLKYALILASDDTIHLEEQPEFIRDDDGQPGLQRIFTASNVPDGLTVALQSADTTYFLNPNASTEILTYYPSLPAQHPPKPQEGFDHRGRYWMEKSDCFTCHELDVKTVGPSLHQIAQRYPDNKETIDQLTQKVKEGGSGNWGATLMNPHPQLSDNEVKTMLQYILSLRVEEVSESSINAQGTVAEDVISESKPGFGTALEGVHPSYDLSTLHSSNFQPKVGGLAFLPDGHLLVTTWDTVGGVYLLDGVETADTSKITVKRIASGLAEPLGIEVVDGEIYVLQKQELTHLIDRDGDEVIDEYRAVCSSWGVTGDFHEFSFGLVYQDGYFYATLSMAMRLMDGEQQQFDRGRTIKISPDGSFEWVNYGLRTPNGIGVNAENDIFVTDNQGQWLPANKLIHVKPGEYHGMAWGILDSMPDPPPMAQPAIWLPEDEIGNSPSEPVLMRDGPYQGQLLHGDVTHGGIKRDFLEKVDGEYQGAVFRFSQGFVAGVNRLCWGPDGALYVGEVGMVGGWSWHGNQFGLQRMEYNGKPTFEMLAIRAKPQGFEVEFTEPLNADEIGKLSTSLLIQQWWYQPTENYGGPKMDLQTLTITKMDISADGTRLSLEIPDLKEEHVVYFRLPENLQSKRGQSLWSNEAWYTLNHIPGRASQTALHQGQ